MKEQWLYITGKNDPFKKSKHVILKWLVNIVNYKYAILLWKEDI